MDNKINLHKKVSETKSIIPCHQRDKLSIFNEIGKKEEWGCGVSGDVRAKAKADLRELNLVLVPENPKEITKKDREKIEKEANRAVRSHYRPRPEYYHVPFWIRKKKPFKMHYLKRLEMEIKLRDGYICQQTK